MDRYNLFGMAETPIAVSIGKCVFPDFITKKIKFNLERLNSRYFFDFF